MKIWGDTTGSIVNITGLFYDNMFYIIRPIVLACGIILMVICNRRFKKELKFDIPWKVVVWLGACEGVVLCAWVTLYALA